MELLIGLFGSQVAAYVAVSVGGLIAAPLLGWILQQIPVEALKKKVGWFMYGAGKGMSLFFGVKFRWTKMYWETAIEPWFIVFLESIVSHGLSEFVRGLRSDNKKEVE